MTAGSAADADYAGGVVALLKYSVLRLALFVAVLALLAVFGMGQLFAIIGAALVSMMLSYLFLSGPRNAAASELAERVQRRAAAHGPSGAQADAAHEDAAVDGGVPEDPPSHG